MLRRSFLSLLPIAGLLAKLGIAAPATSHVRVRLRPESPNDGWACLECGRPVRPNGAQWIFARHEGCA